jgi:hypothetical protein
MVITHQSGSAGVIGRAISALLWANSIYLQFSCGDGRGGRKGAKGHVVERLEGGSTSICRFPWRVVERTTPGETGSLAADWLGLVRVLPGPSTNTFSLPCWQLGLSGVCVWFAARQGEADCDRLVPCVATLLLPDSPVRSPGASREAPVTQSAMASDE